MESGNGQIIYMSLHANNFETFTVSFLRVKNSRNAGIYTMYLIDILSLTEYLVVVGSILFMILHSYGDVRVTSERTAKFGPLLGAYGV